MRILAVADGRSQRLYEHYNPERFGRVDLLLGCGDLAADYMSYLMGIFCVPMLYVKGNHDVSFETDPPMGGEDIDGRIVEYKGIRILGLEGSMRYNREPLQYSQRQMNYKIWKLGFKLKRKGVDVVIAHSPPFGCNDAKDVCHTGFRAYGSLIERFRPRYFLHGHVHMNYGRKTERVAKLYDTYVINCSEFYLLDYEKGPDAKSRLV